ncbi:MAG: PD-(D/E)XK nuclease family protein [Thermodesulfobacteriota bacterium]
MPQRDPSPSGRPAILLVPWDRDFIDAVADHLLAVTAGDFRRVTVLFPLRRAGRFLVDRLRDDARLKKPALLPEIAAVDQWLAELGRTVYGRPLRLLEPLDRVGLLHSIVQDLQGGRGDEAWRGDAAFPAEMHRFFPWGTRLAELCEELFRHGIAARNIDHAASEVLPQAAALLANLKAIHAAYRSRLLESGAATPGLCQCLAGENVPAAMGRLAGSRLFACGFSTPSGSEERLFRPLFQAGRLDVLWHADALVATAPDRAHYSCRELTSWIRRWAAPVVLHGRALPSRPAAGRRGATRDGQHSLFADGDLPSATELLAKKTIRFHEGYDLHSQLLAFSRELAEAPDISDAAVVLPDTGLLMPVLHHLPRRDVNISMGYPLARSSVSRLIETILRLQETRLGPGRYSWRAFLELVRHPYLKMLKVDDAEPLRPLFHAWEAVVRRGGRYLDPFALPEPGGDEDAESGEAMDAAKRNAVRALADRVRHVCLTAFEDAATPRQLGDALAGLVGLLLDEEHSGDIWERFLIDAECLFRVAGGIIPALRGGDLADEHFPQRTLFTLLRGLVQAERAAFEAEPLSGLQVLGMLETRLLSFSRVYVLDAVEDLLPGVAPHDPLLPDALRHLLGLADSRQRDVVAAYTFFRLIMGASEVVLFYRAGVQSAGLFDDKPQRSRFVEQLLWEVEKRRGKIIEPGEPPLSTVSLPLRAIPGREAAVDKTPAVRQALSRILDRPLSSSLLDDYLLCPLRFYYRRVLRLSPLEEVAEEGDVAELGILVHAVLRETFTPFLDRAVTGADISAQALCNRFEAALDAAPFFAVLPPDARLILLRTGRMRLRRYLAEMPPTTPMSLETPLSAVLAAAGREWLFTGTIDRVDRREDGLYILDYKTGKPRKPGGALWEDETFWGRIGDRAAIEDLGLLAEVRERVSSVQLPLYAHLYAVTRGEMPVQAACVELRASGEEIGLFGDKTPMEVRRAAISERTPALVDYLLRHATGAPRFLPQPSRACSWCDFTGLCGGDGVGEE